jgi:hypothetical protein
MKDTSNHNSASIIKNDAGADKHSTEPEQKTPKDNIGKTTNKTLIGMQQQPPTSKLNGMIAASSSVSLVLLFCCCLPVRVPHFSLASSRQSILLLREEARASYTKHEFPPSCSRQEDMIDTRLVV